MAAKNWIARLTGLLGCMFCGMVFASASAPANHINAHSAGNAVVINDLPLANNPPVVNVTLPDLFQHEGEIFQIFVYVGFSDPDGDTLRYEVSNLPDGLSLNPVTGIITGFFAAGSSGTYEVEFRAYDPSNAFASQTATWIINKVNEPPVVVSGIPDQYNDEGETISLDVNAHFNDADGTNLGFEASNLPDGLNMQYGVISGILADGSRGSYETKVTATDLDNATVSDTFTWNVNAPPVVTGNIPDQSNKEGDSVNLDIHTLFSDPEGGALYFQASGLPDDLGIDASSGIISGELAVGSSGNYAIEVKAWDTDDAVVTQTFNWSVTTSTQLLFQDGFE